MRGFKFVPKENVFTSYIPRYLNVSHGKVRNKAKVTTKTALFPPHKPQLFISMV
jgi:hypothetical protein